MQIKDILNRLEESKREKLLEVMRFGIVGCCAALIQLIVYRLLIIKVSSESVCVAVSYGISLCFNYYASTKFTFKVKSSSKKGAGFLLSHGVNITLQIIFVHLFIYFGVTKQIALIPTILICFPINFLLVRFFLKRQ